MLFVGRTYTCLEACGKAGIEPGIKTCVEGSDLDCRVAINTLLAGRRLRIRINVRGKKTINTCSPSSAVRLAFVLFDTALQPADWPAVKPWLKHASKAWRLALLKKES